MYVNKMGACPPVLWMLFAVFVVTALVNVVQADGDKVAVAVTEASMKQCLQALRPTPQDMPASGNSDNTTAADNSVEKAAYEGVIMTPGTTLGAATYLFGPTCFAFRRKSGGPGDYCQMSFRSGRADPENIRCPANGDYALGCRNWGAGGVAATNSGSTDIQYWLDAGPAISG